MASSFLFQEFSDKFPMKKQSFHEILIEKMGPPPIEDTTVAAPNFEFFDHMTPLFHVQVNPVKKSADKAYPTAPTKKKLPVQEKPAVVVPQEIAVAKSSLTDEEKSVWNLFEKTIGKTFELQITRSQAVRAFRVFAKLHHPDVAQKSSNVNFAYVVKIKNEMLMLLDKKIKNP